MRTRKSTDVECIAYKFTVKPTEKQKVLFSKAFGCKRFLYNVMLSDESYHYKVMGSTLRNEVSDYKEDYPFLCEVDSLVLANAKLNLTGAFQKFFDGSGNYPVFKKKSGRQSFTTNCSNKKKPNLVYDVGKCLLKLPKVEEPLLVVQHRKIKLGGILKSATVSMETNGIYYVSMLFEYPKTKTSIRIMDTPKAIGLDMSMEHFYVDSDGNHADFSRFYRTMENRLAKEQAKLSRMVRNSHNYKKQKRRISKLYAKIKHQRSDYLHKLSYNLVMTYDVICIESLNMKGMSKSLHLGKSVHDLGWGEFVRMLSYKCERYGKTLIMIDKFYPSSKTCGNCGYLHKDLALADRIFVCPKCNHLADRDWQAATNILKEGLRIYFSQMAA